MALITDPDNLSQGTENVVADLAFTASAAAVTTLTGSTSLPAIAAGEFFEIRDSSIVGNNGLYVETGGTPTTSAITATKVVGPNPADLAAESTSVFGTTGAGSEKSVHFDTPTVQMYLLEQGNLSVDGVTQLALHSFMKEEWKQDNFLIAAAAFPMTGISNQAGEWQYGQDPSGNNNGWKPAEDVASPAVIKTKRLIRNAGWDEIDANGNILKSYFNVTTLPTAGAFEDPADLAYFQFGDDPTDLGAAVDFEFAGEVNEPVLYFDEIGNPPTCDFNTSNTITRASGSFITDGYQVGGMVTVRNADNPAHDGNHVLTGVAALTLTVAGTPFTGPDLDTNAQLAINNSNAFKAFLRIRDADTNGKTFTFADLAAAGETSIVTKKIPMGLSNVPDLDIVATDATIAGSSPWTEIRLRYLDAAYNREVDSATKRNFGIVIDVGTYSRQNGASSASVTFTSADHVLGLGEDLADYAGGTLIIHEGTDQGSHAISGTPTGGATLTITLSSALTDTEANLSFTMQRSSPVVADRNEIYEKVQYQLRQAADIDGTQNAVNGRTADAIMVFEGANLRVGKLLPVNPNGGGSGVIIEGFDANDTNNLFFWDNSGVSRNFPFVAAGSIVVNQGLVDDTDGEAWLFYEYTARTNIADGAVVSPSGDSYDLESPGSFLPALIVNDYILIAGFAQAENNGLFIVTAVNISTQDYSVRKIDGTNVGTVESGQTIDVDENPFPSPDAIIVQDNGASDIAFNIGGLSTPFDFDYDNNVQGGRASGTNANVALQAAGKETGQFAIVKGLVITRAVGLSFAVTSARERNYENL